MIGKWPSHDPHVTFTWPPHDPHVTKYFQKAVITLTVCHVVFNVLLLAQLQLNLQLKSAMLIPNVLIIQLEQVNDLHLTVITNICAIHLDSVAMENTIKTIAFQDNTLTHLTVSFSFTLVSAVAISSNQLILISGGCLPIDDLLCGTVCSNPYKTIHPTCENHPTGVSARYQVTIDGEISCNSFGYCKDGDYIIEEWTSGQYFDGGPSKST